MNEEKKDVAPNATSEEVAPEATETVEEEIEVNEEGEEIETQESLEELRERLAKAEEVANNYKIRAEKAEKAGKVKPPTTANELNSKDLVAIMNAKVPEDDIDEVVEYAKYRKTSISDILKDPIMKATLDLRAEERNTSSAANTNTSRRGSTRVPDDILLSNASRGKMPEGDAEIARLMKAKYKAGK